MADDQFKSRLQDISGEDSEMWEGFDASAWRSHQDEFDGPEDLELAGAVSDPQEDDYDSEDSARMVFNFHKLSEAERARGSIKLSKARQYASEEVAFPSELAELEKVKWPETGLAMGDLSEKGLTFVPWRLIDNYPAMFVGKANGARVSVLFRIGSRPGFGIYVLTISRPSLSSPPRRFMTSLSGTCKSTS